MLSKRINNQFRNFRAACAAVSILCGTGFAAAVTAQGGSCLWGYTQGQCVQCRWRFGYEWKDGDTCLRPCGGFCIPTAPNAFEHLNDSDFWQGSLASPVTIPDYAVIQDPVACSGESVYQEGEKIAIFVPTELLEASRIFALRFDEPFLRAALKVDPAIAWALMSFREGKEYVTPYLEFEEFVHPFRSNGISEEFVLHWFEHGTLDGSGDHLRTHLPGLSETLELRTRFNGGGQPLHIKVKRTQTLEGSEEVMFEFNGHIEINPDPVDAKTVWASDNYLAPVYAVAGFWTDPSR